MASNPIVEYCLAYLKSKGEEAMAARQKLLDLRQKNLDDLHAKYVDLKKALNLSENRLTRELTSAYDVEFLRYDTCLAQISERMNEVKASNKIDASDIGMPALWNRRYFVKCVSEVKRAVQEMTLGSKTDETWLETNILSPQVEEKFNVGGLPVQHSTPQSQPNQINVNVTLSTDNSTTKSRTVTINKQASSSIDSVISDLKKKCMKRPAEKSCSTKQSNGDDGDDDVDEMDGNDDDDCGGDDSENGDNVDKLPLGRKLLKLFKTSSVRSEKHLTTRDDTRGNGEGPTKKTTVTESFEKDKSTNVVRKETVETVLTAESPVTANTGKKEQLTKVREIVSCKECAKARCVYSENNLTESERAAWEEYRSNSKTLPYCCGVKLFPKDHILTKVMWVEKDLKSCESEINPHYYGVRVARKLPLLCYKCGGLHHIEAISAEDLKEWISIDPACSQCILWKKVRGPRKRRKRVKVLNEEDNKSDLMYPS